MIYDPFQQTAIDYINQGFSVIVSAPTGAGKTAIAEHVIESCLKEKSGGVIYTAPIKALSNQKFRDFQKNYRDDIGILTGDVSLNPFAPVLIMTTEIFRNKILDQPETLKKYKWVIFDEIHYLDNQERGTVWEEALMFMPEHMRILGLSATIPNIKELCLWIESIHRKPIKSVIENNRPVPLHFFYQYNNEVSANLNPIKNPRNSKPNKTLRLIEYIQQHEGLPCIYFVFGRRRAEELAHDLSGFNFLSHQERTTITQMYKGLCRMFDLEQEPSAVDMYPLIEKGVAFHHAGMLPTLKEAIERLFTSKLIKVIFTTETFALGINMPSKSVAFDELRKFYGRYVRSLKTRDFYQMAGRAGRRGIDKEGFVYSRVNPFRIQPHEVKKIIYSPPEEVISQFNTSYATILNLYEKHRDKVLEIYPRTLHYFQSRKNRQKEALRLMDAKLKLLKKDGHIQNDMLTQKGAFAKTVYSYELLMAELFVIGALEQMDEVQLALTCLAAVFEPRKGQEILDISHRARKVRRYCEEIFAHIKEKEESFRIYPSSKMPYFNLSTAMEAWLNGTQFNKILKYTDTDEGEIIRYFRMSVQILREINDNKVSSAALHKRLGETIRVINRDIVNAENQLRKG
ncbi:MAG: DEAD/DEAH box helicase [Candidatus Omnitrophica bacterium]|jgi:superfamily II RNA helicase|nr:DEAD/DEAH box helicase [Candidatus Omnitrophota bacterium]